MTDTLRYIVIMIAAGIGVPILAAMNTTLGVRLGNPAAAAMCLFAIALICATAVFLIGGAHGFEKFSTAPKYLLLGGTLIAFYLLSITWVAPHFGIGNAVFAVLLGQLASAALIDHFGLFGAAQTSLSLTRSSGILVMAFGVYLTQVGRQA